MLVSVRPKSIELGQMANLNVIFECDGVNLLIGSNLKLVPVP